MENEKELRRRFGGKTANFKAKTEKAFEQKHLRAYLKGHERFRMGFNSLTGEPNWYKVHYLNKE